jgi:hypothetical protein
VVLVRNYGSNPWMATSLAVVALLLVLTVIQTFFLHPIHTSSHPSKTDYYWTYVHGFVTIIKKKLPTHHGRIPFIQI